MVHCLEKNELTTIFDEKKNGESIESPLQLNVTNFFIARTLRDQFEKRVKT